ncbi:GNAT family N-acetyltransferase [Aestuariimicrobium sp. p3-SID1156]|uniref:GNAT family N-acetyltransferase n=1 Tax=Aestuariimicrobium sp. p3-SID1156 TaxID=2916038 RepID=UPI00223AF0F7|nr:GNAT family N-acetyltransferase [Aestuariimicrobium sp. p3-SID1156]MCT1460380.1 GNAT family N-acetyltransferase [Aestuariimicrobium sp. p3-SID1156]
MPSDLMTLHLTAATSQSTPTELVPLDRGRTQELAEAYFNAYPPGIACTTTDEAVREIHETFAGEYGDLRCDASAMAVHDGRVVGAVFVVERSIWDAELDGPFIIDLFVDPVAQGMGLGRALVQHAANQCAAAGDEQLSLRVGAGTSLAAQALYEHLGFVRD